METAAAAKEYIKNTPDSGWQAIDSNNIEINYLENENKFIAIKLDIISDNGLNSEYFRSLAHPSGSILSYFYYNNGSLSQLTSVSFDSASKSQVEYLVIQINNIDHL